MTELAKPARDRHRISESPELEDDWRSFPPRCTFPFAPVPPGIEPHQSVPFELAPSSRSPSPSWDEALAYNAQRVKEWEERNPQLLGYARQNAFDPHPLQIHVNRMKRLKGFYDASNPDPEGRDAKYRKKEWTEEELLIPNDETEAEEWAEAARQKARAVDDSGVQELAKPKSSQESVKASQGSQGKRSMLGSLGFTVGKPVKQAKKGSDSQPLPKLVYFDSTEEETDDPISTSRSPDPPASQTQLATSSTSTLHSNASLSPINRKPLLSTIDAETQDNRPNLSRGISGFETYSQFDLIGNMAAIEGGLRDDLVDMAVLDSQVMAKKDEVASDVDELEDDEMVDQLESGEEMDLDDLTAL